MKLIPSYNTGSGGCIGLPMSLAATAREYVKIIFLFRFNAIKDQSF